MEKGKIPALCGNAQRLEKTEAIPEWVTKSEEESMISGTYRAIISSDWSECLSPNGPFDPISFLYPDLKADLARIFSQYTGNLISLDAAISQIKTLLPAPLTIGQMDEYLDASFQTYRGVPDLIQWCLDRDILFMINSTGTHGYFERAQAKGLLPLMPVVSANPLVVFNAEKQRYYVNEIEDKPKNTETVFRSLNLPAEKLVVIGDSGGDGPHFHWAAQIGGHPIASMAKHSLVQYCADRGVVISSYFGLRYGRGESRDIAEEMKIDFRDLKEILLGILGL